MPVIQSLPVAFQRINAGATATNYEGATTTQIATGDGSKSFVQRTLMRTGLVQVPDGHEIVSAVLRVYVSAASGSGSKSITVHHIADDDTGWVPDEATWASKDFGVAWGVAGGNPGVTTDVSASVTLETGVKDFDLTNVLAYAVSKSPFRIDAVVKMTSELNDSKTLTIASRTWPEISQHPRMIVVMNPISIERRGGDQPFVPAAGGWAKRGSQGD